MKSIRPLISCFGVALWLAGSGLQAAPHDSQGGGHHPSRQQSQPPSQQHSQQHSQHQGQAQGGHDRASNRGQATHTREPVRRDSQHTRHTYSPPRSVRPSHSPYPVRHQQPPRDFRQVHQRFHQRRAQIGHGRALPRHIHVVKGRPLPRGYGHRLDARSLRGLPQYHGYEWLRTGSDIVLIAVTSGIVYTILRGVLN